MVTASPSAFQLGDARLDILIVFGNQRTIPGNYAVEEALRERLDELAPGRVQVFSEFLDLEYFGGPEKTETIANFLHGKYADADLRAIVTVAPSALKFMLEHRERIAPGVPIVYTSVSRQTTQELAPPADVVGVTVEFAIADTLALALRQRPQARRVVMPVGASDFDRLWEHRVRTAAPPVPVQYLSGYTFAELEGKLAELKDDSIVFIPGFFGDIKNTMYTGPQVITKFASASAAPVYTTAESGIGSGAVGGYIVTFEQQGRLTGDIVARIIDGVAPTSSLALTATSEPMFDWRQLQRWKIDEAQLPSGSIVKYREPSLLERYRWYIAAGIAALLLQTLIIGRLLIERAERRRAQLETRKRFAEMAHMNRSVALGTLSASIAHELNQPLGAILNNAGAAEMLIHVSPPPLQEIHDILGDIKRDDQRASAVIARIRTLLRKSEFELRDIDLNQSVGEVMRFLVAEASVRGVALLSEFDLSLPTVRADTVQLQQVVINLALNGMDAMRERTGRTRTLVVRTSKASNAEAEVSVADSGTGIASDCIGTVFEPFYTTKTDGMGLGLSISRTIVEAHGGRILAENARGGGAIIRFTIPFSGAESR